MDRDDADAPCGAQHSDVQERLSDAVFSLVSKATGADLLRFITDREVAEVAGLSAARVRRAFSRHPGTEQLDRRRMLDVATAQALDALDAVHAARASRWCWAVGGYRDQSGCTVARALLDVCAVRCEEDDEKLAALALSLAGDDECLRDLLSYASRRRQAHYRAAVLDLLGRARGAGADATDVEALTLLASLIAAHVSEQRRLGERVDPETVARGFARAWDVAVGGRPRDAEATWEHESSHRRARSAEGRT